MVQAVKNLLPNFGNYCLIGNNCQDFSNALRDEYNKIAGPPEPGSCCK